MNSPVCNYDPATTVFCHLNEQFAGKGFGIKADDFGFYGCSNCHDLYDGRRGIVGWQEDKYFYLLKAVYKTWKRMIDKGILVIK